MPYKVFDAAGSDDKPMPFTVFDAATAMIATSLPLYIYFDASDSPLLGMVYTQRFPVAVFLLHTR